MTDTIKLHNIDKVRVHKTTQKNSRDVEKVKIYTPEHEISLFGSKDENSDKDKTIKLEVTEK